MKNNFLTAEWRKLILVNYEVDPNLLLKYLPKGTVLDFWNGKCYVSLVAFLFRNSRVKGIKIPFHVNFEEANLRFYVKHKTANGEWKKGVVFIKEIVPKKMITLVANTIYHEHYQTLAMSHSIKEKNDVLEIIYRWKNKENKDSVKVKAKNKTINIERNSEADFITEHFWGYTRINENKTSEYEVSHPNWKIYPILEYEIDINFKALYGEDFENLKELTPDSVMLAEGSEIKVGNKRMI